MWILGYLTRVNATLAAMLANQHQMVTYQDMTHGIRDDGIFAWVDKYCIDHPSDTVAIAAEGLYVALANRDAEASSAVAEAIRKYLDQLERPTR
jgi:hypothetical protein